MLDGCFCLQMKGFSFFSRKLPVISQINRINYISDVCQSTANNTKFPKLVKPKSPGLVNFSKFVVSYEGTYIKGSVEVSIS